MSRRVGARPALPTVFGKGGRIRQINATSTWLALVAVGVIFMVTGSVFCLPARDDPVYPPTWSRLKSLNIYSHVLPDMGDHAASAMEAALQ